jgi:hypothetical protein
MVYDMGNKLLDVTSYQKRYQRYYRGKGVSNLTDEIIHNLMAQDRP